MVICQNLRALDAGVSGGGRGGPGACPPAEIFPYNFTLDNSTHVLSMLQVGKKTGYCSQEKRIHFIATMSFLLISPFFKMTKYLLLPLNSAPRFKLPCNCQPPPQLNVILCKPFFPLSTVICPELPITHTLLISLEGSSYQESPVFV